MTDKLDFLDQLALFKNLTEEELETLADLATEYKFEEGAVIAYQRDPADNFYIVKEGRLFARRVDENGIVRDTRSYFAGDHFKDVWLFEPRAHDATVRAATEGRLLTLGRDEFLDFLALHPGALEGLEPQYTEDDHQVAGLSEEAWAEAQKSQIAPARKSYGDRAGLMADELVEFVTRRSIWLLVIKLIVPFVLFVLFGAAYLYLRTILPLLDVGWINFVLSLLLVLVFVGILLYQWFDWSNDYFLITNRHVMHYEYNLAPGNFGSRVNKTPIDQIQSVEVVRPNVFSNLFDVGTARITTASREGVILFDFISDPHEVRDTLNRIRQRVKELDAGREQVTMRRSLEDHFQTGASYRPVQADDETAGNAEELAAEGFLQSLRRRYGSRVVQGSVITYRKHILVLFAAAQWPLVALAVHLALLTLALVYLRSLFGLALGGLFLLTGAAIGLWLLWQVEDWRNDTYQVTDFYVIDIDRSPFGTGEARKQAQLNNVQNVSSDRPGLLPNMFNYGNVYIETAGASTDITFENVSNPNRIQRDIFERREQFIRRQQVGANSARRKELALMLDVYQQVREQGQIPRRTAPPESEG
ncbi:MAG: cyclic nucleotide-binding domain-containing protein [Candidatus Promineifilaceae bacterium]|nr:cyclic nucleotide-binding domain-containing protein [Candidatus Promineifilaceae bacterium]